MMSRTAIYDTLLADSRLVALGLDANSLLVNYDGEQRPTDEIFLVLAWMPEDNILRGDDTFNRTVRNITIWVHIYKEFSTDFNRIDRIIDILDDIFANMIHVQGTDGQTVTMVETAGRSRDMRDDTYQTICRSASYRVLSRETATV
jgi:hypothetical protein